MKRIISLFASLLAAGTVLSAQEYESISDVLVEYGKLEGFTCEVAEGDDVSLYFLFHDNVPEFLDEATLPQTTRLVHFFPSGDVYEDDADSFVQDFSNTLEYAGYQLFSQSDVCYEFIRSEESLVYEYVIYDLSGEDSVHIWVLLGDYDISSFIAGGDVASILFAYMSFDGFSINVVEGHENLETFVQDQFDLYGTSFGDRYISMTMYYDDGSFERDQFLTELNEALEVSYEQYGQTPDGGMYFCKSDETTLFQLVYIIWEDNELHIHLVEGELPLEQFVVG